MHKNTEMFCYKHTSKEIFQTDDTPWNGLLNKSYMIQRKTYHGGDMNVTLTQTKSDI